MKIIFVVFMVVMFIFLFVLAVIDDRRKKEIANLKLKLAKENEDKSFFCRETERLKMELDSYKEKEKEDFNSDNNKIIKDTFKGKRVLIGDYNKEMLKNTKRVFLSLGFDVDTVDSGDAILDKILHGYTCDVIVTNNIYKKGCNGINMTQQLKDIKGFNIPVVVLTVSINKRDYFLEYYDEYMEKYLTQEKAEKAMANIFKMSK